MALLTTLLLVPLATAQPQVDAPPDGAQSEVQQEEEPEGEVFVVEEPRAVVRALPGATVTSLDVSDDAARMLDLGDLLAASPGVRVRSAGGSGGLQLLQLRGATGGEVRVLVDGVPLPQDASGAVDLSSLPLDSVERIEVYRGTLPLGLGGEGVAGAINIITRKPRGLGELSLSGGAGSFHSYEGGAGLDAGAGAWRGGLWLAGASARNDYPFLDDNGTPYTSADDDPQATRLNADSQRVELSARALREGPLRLSTSAGAVLREVGVPGPASYQVSEARLGERRAQGELRLEGGEDTRGSGGASVVASRQRYADPEGEVGLGQQDQVSTSLAASVDGLLELPLPLEHTLALALRLEEQRLVADNTLDSDAAASRQRDRASGTLELRGLQGTLGYGARASLDASRSGAEGGMPMSHGAEEGGETLLLFSPSGSAAWRPLDQLGLRVAGGLGHRLPTFPELYGDAGTVVGNEELRPERGVTADLGADLALEGERGLALLAMTGFHRELWDLIAYVQNSQYTLRAENFERVRIGGLELEGGGSVEAGALGSLELGLAYTFTRSVCLASYAGTQGSTIPGLPEHAGFAELELGGERLGGAVGVEAQGASYRDSANLQRIPGRALLHARLSGQPWRRGPALTLELRNALDHRTERSDIVDLDSGGPAVQAVSDFLGYPLPGRAVFLSASWSWAP